MRTSSFTSLSSAGTILVLALAAVLSAAFSWHAKQHWQVEGAYFGEAHRISHAYAEALRTEHPNICIVFGGSTSRTSYIPSLLLQEYGIPIVNCGLHAGFGRDVITEFAMTETRPGDTVIVAFEPSFLAQETDSAPSSAGIDFFLYMRGLSFHRNSFFSLSPLRFPGCLAGNTRYNVFMAMKKLRRMKPYRYVASDNLHKDGWMEVFEKRPLPSGRDVRPPRPVRLGKSGRAFLLKIRNECERRGCRLFYQLPPMFSDNPYQRAAYASLLLDISEIVPVVADPMLGVNSEPSEFADTPQHPLATGAIRASRSFGAAFSSGAVWDEHSLLTIIAQNPSVEMH